MPAPVLLVTGALTGIGRAPALAFAREEAKVVASGRREEEGEKLVEALRSIGAEAVFGLTDIRKEADVQSLIEWTVVVAALSCGFGGVMAASRPRTCFP
jgi:NAD(P)-dependent dehydrogenase (short-subunit alcohol dehydrogenase family)